MGCRSLKVERISPVNIRTDTLNILVGVVVATLTLWRRETFIYKFALISRHHTYICTYTVAFKNKYINN